LEFLMFLRRQKMQFETLYQDLVQGAEIIRALVTGVTQADASFKPNPESWSVLEVMCHLYDEEREDFRQHLDSILHRPTEQWTPFDPGTWVIERAYNERDLAVTLDGFLAEREKSLAWLKGLSTPNWEAEHSDQFGSITAGEMFTAWVDHDNLHIRQLVELRHERIISQARPFETCYAGEW
jgi:hypothetical protein